MWYFRISELIYHIHYHHGFKVGKQDELLRRSGKEKCRIDAYFCDKGHLLHLEKNNIGEEEDAEDVELQGIDVVA